MYILLNRLSSLLVCNLVVSSFNGDDARNSGSFSAPYITIQKAADVMQANDICMIRAGTYRETVTAKTSTTRFEAYNGEAVFISGSDLVTNWIIYKGNFYKAYMPWTMDITKNQAFVNGRHLIEARSPNIDQSPQTPVLYSFKLWRPARDRSLFLPVLATVKWSSPNVIVFPSTTTESVLGVNQPANAWVGGVYWGNNRSWWCQASLITASNGNNITVDPVTQGWVPEMLTGGYGCIMGILAALDAPGEFHWQNDTLYIWTRTSDNPNNHVVEAKRRFLGFKAESKSNIDIKNVRFFCHLYSTCRMRPQHYRCMPLSLYRTLLATSL